MKLLRHPNIFIGCELVQLKPGGRIPEKGKKISLVVKSVRDLNRDVIKVSTYFIGKLCVDITIFLSLIISSVAYQNVLS